MSKKEIPFVLMHGAGNMFIMINNDEQNLSIAELAEFMTKNYPLHFPVDGLMAYRSSHSNDHDFSIDYLNPDGSHGSMCGNGARCAIKYHVEYIQQFKDESCDMRFLMAGTLYTGRYQDFGSMISVLFPNEPIVKELQLNTEQGMIHVFHVFNGSDHLIMDASNHHIPSEDFFVYDINPMSKPLRHHPALANGANVNYAMIMPDNLIRLRTFERGVERETAACGTGALATAYVYATFAQSEYLSDFKGTYPIRVQVQSGDILMVDRNSETGQLSLIGPAEFLSIQEGYIMYSEFQKRVL